MSDDEKKCPQCAESVKQDAVICRFCRYDFAQGRSPGERPGGAPQKVIVGPQKNSFQSCMGCVGVGLLILFALMTFGSATDDPPPADEYEVEGSQ